jgi:hypothetical protein
MSVLKFAEGVSLDVDSLMRLEAARAALAMAKEKSE